MRKGGKFFISMNRVTVFPFDVHNEVLSLLYTLQDPDELDSDRTSFRKLSQRGF